MGVISSIRQRIKYYTARSDARFNERADPRVQLEQAIAEAQDQHRRLKEQAANIIANQKQAELRLNRQLADYEKVSTNTRQALVLADQAARSGDATKAQDYQAAAEEFAGRLVAMEHEIDDTKALVLQSSQAAEQAKAAVAQNADGLQRKLAERQKLLSQLDQAKMQEQMNTAMTSLGEAVGEDVPSFDEIRDKIEARYAKARGIAELSSTAVSDRMLEIERQSMNTEALDRLAEMRAQMGLPAGATEASLESGSSAAGELSGGGSDTVTGAASGATEATPEAADTEPA
jgi:phage shock protein A